MLSALNNSHISNHCLFLTTMTQLFRIDGTLISESETLTFVELVHVNKTNLSYANLRSANLSYANLRNADLRNADLRGADLRGADLSSANLSSANLSGADLRNADLRGADLRGADLSSANLSSANLSGADLRNADLRGAASTTLTFLSIYGIGSVGRQTLYIPEIDKVWCGCFSGTMAKFEAQIANKYSEDTKHGKAYRLAAQYLKEQAIIYNKVA